jgi:hypothetical protein
MMLQKLTLLTALLLGSTSALAAEPSAAKLRHPTQDRITNEDFEVDLAAPATQVEVTVHSVQQHLIVVAVPLEPRHEEDYLKLGFRRAKRAEEIGGNTLFGGMLYIEYVSALTPAQTEHLAGKKATIVLRRTGRGSPVIVAIKS